MQGVLCVPSSLWRVLLLTSTKKCWQPSMFLHGEPEKISRKDQRFTLARSKSLSAEFWIWDLPAHHLHTHTPSTQSQIKTMTTILQTDTTCTCSNLVCPSSFHPPFLMLTKTKTRDMFAICCFHPFLHFQTWFVNVCQFLDFPTPSIWWSFVYQLWSKSSSFFGIVIKNWNAQKPSKLEENISVLTYYSPLPQM